MKNILKGKTGTIVILGITFILAGIAIFTAARLYQLRSQPVAPNVPSSIPLAAENTVPTAACTTSYSLVADTGDGGGGGGTTPTDTPEQTDAPTATNTPTPTEVAANATKAPIPVTGANWPTLVGIGVGILTIAGSLILAF